MSRRPTSADVAHRAGVSRATVSYVLNNVAHQSISDATRQRVRAAAAELDYTPHVAAQTLRAGESKLVLFINTGVPYGTNLSTMVAALASDVAASGRSLVLWQQQDPNDLAATLSHLQPVLAIALGELNGVQRALLARSHVPCVQTVAGRRQGDPSTELQIRHLAETGHRQLGYVTTNDPALALFARPRLAAARGACERLGLEPPAVAELPALHEISVGELGDVLGEWARRRNPVAAVACYNDVVAAACLTAATQAGLTVPTDLAVVGMDDEPMSAFLQPSLTTVRLDMTDFAHHLWARARAVLDNAPVPRLPAARWVSLVHRDSG
jgi:DNA-binding LacI/PurR family transcriptional regulator